MAKRIYLSGKKGAGLFALVDNEDFDRISRFNWNLDAGGYAISVKVVNGRTKRIKMHREVMQAPPEMDVDHRRGRRLDNRKSQLRLCTKLQNKWNTQWRGNRTGFIGVQEFLIQKVAKYRAKISHNNKHYHLGLFETPEAAARAYNEKAIELRGEFARLNPV